MSRIEADRAARESGSWLAAKRFFSRSRRSARALRTTSVRVSPVRA